MPDHVLVVDDDQAIRTLIRDILEDEGYTVGDAMDGEALRAAAERRPAVILLDLMMPVMDGYEVGRRLRADPHTAGIPIVVMSAGSKAQAGAARIGAETYLSKPFDLETLLSTVGAYAAAR